MSKLNQTLLGMWIISLAVLVFVVMNLDNESEIHVVEGQMNHTVENATNDTSKAPTQVAEPEIVIEPEPEPEPEPVNKKETVLR